MQTPDPARKKRWVLVLAVALPIVVIIAGGLAVYLGGKSSADGAAESYAGKLSDWQDEQAENAKDLTEESAFSDNVVVGSSVTSTQTSEQKDACAKVKKVSEESDAGFADPPKLKDNTFSSLSDDFSKAEKRQSAVSKKVDGLRDDKRKLLKSLAAECAFHNERVAIEQAQLAATIEVRRRLDPRGSSSPGAGACTAIQGCIPASGQRLAAYVNALERARVAPASAFLRLAESDVCKESSYRPMCDAQAAYNRGMVPVEKSYVALLRSARNTAGNSLIAGAIVRRGSDIRRLTTSYTSAYRSAFPDVNQFALSYETKREQEAMSDLEDKLADVDKKISSL